MYEVQVNFDLISGKLTDTDVSHITCDYKDNELWSLVTKKQHESSKYVLRKPILILLKDMLPSDNNTMKIKTKLGGGHKSRRNRKKNNKTMKRKLVKR